MGYYATSSDNFLATFRDNLSVHPQGSSSPLKTEDGTDMLAQNVGKKLPLLAA